MYYLYIFFYKMSIFKLCCNVWSKNTDTQLIHIKLHQSDFIQWNLKPFNKGNKLLHSQLGRVMSLNLRVLGVFSVLFLVFFGGVVCFYILLLLLCLCFLIVWNNFTTVMRNRLMANQKGIELFVFFYSLH